VAGCHATSAQVSAGRHSMPSQAAHDTSFSERHWRTANTAAGALSDIKHTRVVVMPERPEWCASHAARSYDTDLRAMCV
jgi:hypothetical protein